MRIVHAQREAMDEFKELTAEAVKLRPPECDTEFRVEVEGEMVPLTIYLPEEPFDFRRYRKATDRKARMALKQERQEQLRKSQSQVAQDIEEFGGLITNYEYITNVLDVDVPICALDKIASLPSVLGIEKDSAPPMPANVDGMERRQALGLPSAGHSIFTGVLGSTRNNNARIRFGVIESRSQDSNKLNTTHLSFNQSSNGVSRIIDTDVCKFWFPSYRCINSATGTASTHGTMVTSVLLSDFSRAQSSAVTGIERYKRSGIAPRATAHYYSTKGWRTVRSAVKEASLEDGIDVINMSMQTKDDSIWCSSPTLNGTRAALEAAVDAGVVPIACAGNYGRNSKCNVSLPAAYTSTISVGGTNTARNLSALETASKATNSSHGKIDVNIAGGRTVEAPLVTVMANYCHKRLAGDGTLNESSDCGTSYAAPSIAGIVGLIKHWISYRGGLPQGMSNDPLAIRAILSLMGDGRAPLYSTMFHIDNEFGFGNVRFVDFDNDIGEEGSWGIKKINVTTGSVVEWPIHDGGIVSEDVQGFKAVILADGYNRGNSPDIEFQLQKGCSTTTAYYIADRGALEWRFRIPEVFVPHILHDDCLSLRVKADAVKNTATLYIAWVLFSNDRIHHDTNAN